MVELDADEAAARLTKMGETFGNFAEYVENAAPRVIPAFAINRV